MFSNDLQTSYPEATRFLTNAVVKDRLANSYIFIGKDSNDILKITKNLAKALNCSRDLPRQVSTPWQALTAPCEQCINCKWIERNEHPQAFIIVSPDPESKKEQIKVDNIRELLNTLNTSSECFRVIYFPVSGLQFLPPDSCNLLLKTVEETPEKTIFIFANQSRNDILGTILSRSQIIYITKKYNSVAEIINTNVKNEFSENIADCFSKNIVDSLEKAKQTSELIQKNEIGLKDYLTNLAVENYNNLKYKNQKQYCRLYKSVSEAHTKLKAFMQPKIIIEDLFLSLLNSQ